MALKDAPRCTAKSKRTGEQCQNPACVGMSVCRHHGGKSLSGIAHPSFRSGRYSKHLPARLSSRYHEAQADVKLLELREEIALTDARLADVLVRVDTGESGALWKLLRAAFDHFKRASSLQDGDGMAAALYDIERLIERGTSDYAAWHEVSKLLDQRRRLVESERKRVIEAQLVMTIEEANVLLAAMTNAIQRHVQDRATLQAISTEFAQLVSVAEN